MTSDLVRYELRETTVVLTLNRPDKRNALSRNLIAELTESFKRAAADTLARSVILTGAESVFCAGMDLEEVQGTVGAGSDIIWSDALKLAELYDLIYTLAKPTIAAVNGHAVAGGRGTGFGLRSGGCRRERQAGLSRSSPRIGGSDGDAASASTRGRANRAISVAHGRVDQCTRRAGRWVAQ